MYLVIENDLCLRFCLRAHLPTNEGMVPTSVQFVPSTFKVNHLATQPLFKCKKQLHPFSPLALVAGFMHNNL